MCGIGGFFRTADNTTSRDTGLLQSMGEAIRHRGPDAEGVWLDDEIGLIHRRLSIIDLSVAGNQPMLSRSGRHVIVFNGEIYNYQALRRSMEAEGEVFDTRTDTEVVLRLYEREGEACLKQLNGMFAIAIWDKKQHTLFLARDRLGKKPLYYYQWGDHFAFASEIKALLKLPWVKREVRPDAVKDFFFYQYVPDPKTIFAQVHKLTPGHCVTVHCKQVPNVASRPYWQLNFNRPLPENESAIVDDLYNLIDDAVKTRMVSDVPLGAFLSGGVDSSAVVGLMARHNANQPVTTCAIGFDSKRFDEVMWARKVADLFQTNHHEFTVRENVADSLTDIAGHFDEPFADPSFIPTYFVSQLARQKVTVALAGDGGDENFAGYSKYQTDQTENHLRACFPGSLRRNFFPMMANLAGRINHPLPRKGQSLLSTLAQEPDQGFFTTNSFFRQSLWDELVTGHFKRQTDAYDPAEVTRAHYRAADTDDHVSKILYTDIKTYLPGDILVKVDRMSMANSLETRAPLLDYRVVEYAAKLPSALKLKGREKKYILKHSFQKLLPNDVLYRPKMGFSVPLSDWLRNEIFEVADGIFRRNDGGLAQCFDMHRVRELWQSHQEGHSHHTQELWSMVAFELWWRAYQQ